MKHTIRCDASLILTALFLIGASTQAQQFDARFERTFDIDDAIELDVAAGSGSIVVRSGSEGRARVVGELRIHEFNRGFWAFWRRGPRPSEEDVDELIERFETEPPVELRGGVLMVGHIEEEWRRGFSVSYEIEVPAGTDVQARTGSGRTRIEGLQGGRIEAMAGSGGVMLRDVEGDIMARSGSGSIRAEEIAGDFEGHAGSGSITVDLVTSGQVSVSTGSGSIRVAGVNGALMARAGSGGINIDGAPTDAWDVSTGSGSVRLHLPADAAFDLDARTGSGGLSTDHPLTIQGNVDRRRLQGQVRGGGPLITARTGSGGIRID